MRIDISHSELFSTIFESIVNKKLNHPITGISIDSRTLKKGDLFVAINGNRSDGHLFIKKVYEMGASAAIVEKINNNIEFQQIETTNTVMTLGSIAMKWREQFKIPIVAITGSNGKTSTKELLVHTLSKKFNIHSTYANQNTFIGLSMTLLRLSDVNEISILELGASRPGEIKTLCEIAKPTHGLITNIAPAHFEGFGSIENIVHEKGELFQSLNHGISFINKTDPYINGINFIGEKISYGLSPDCDFPADIFHEDDGTLSLVLDTHILKTLSTNLSFLKNSMAISAIAITLGLDWNDLKKQLLSFTPPKGRCNVIYLNDITIIDDTYNANLSSSIASLDYLKAFSTKGRRIFVFGDMYELGDLTNSQHIKIGEKCSELKLDIVYTIGLHSKMTHNAIKNKVLKKHFSSKDSLIKTLKGSTRPSDLILFKGSRGMEMEKIISGAFEI